jgi:hypothetical protein
MSLKGLARGVALVCAGWAFAAGSYAFAWGEGCGCCDNHHCPPAYVHCQEGPPCIKFKCACPKPVCNPCELPCFGYYQTCWRPWPCPPNWSHCPVPPPGAVEPCPPEGAVIRAPEQLPATMPGQQMPYAPSPGNGQPPRPMGAGR